MAEPPSNEGIDHVVLASLRHLIAIWLRRGLITRRGHDALHKAFATAAEEMQLAAPPSLCNERPTHAADPCHLGAGHTGPHENDYCTWVP